MKRFRTYTAVIAGIAASQITLGTLAYAQETARSPDLDVEIGAAGGFSPSYEGSRKLSATGLPLFTLNFIRLPFFGEFGGKSNQGWSFAPSFNIVSERKQSDDRRLRGLGNIGTAVEFGGKVSYRWQNIRLFALARRGFGGHKGWVGEIGADFIAKPAPRWKVEIGPRVEFADSTYTNRYFGVNAAQSLASGYAIYSAGGGVKGAGAASKITYRLNDKWAVVGQAKYIRLVGDVGKAPLVRAGSANMFSASVGLSYRLITNFSR